MIMQLEELSLNAWPAPHTLVLDGWVLRFASGYGRRANSVSPLYAGSQPLEDRLAACEDLYTRHGQDTIFKLTPAAQPEALDEFLAARGYAHEAPTSVQTLDLATASINPTGSVRLYESLSDEWLADYCRLSQIPERQQPALRSILSGLVPEHRFMSLDQDEEVVACGLTVLQDGFAGLYDIVTHPAQRGQGNGRHLIDNLLAWARDCGARDAYLQVMLNNAPALRLYGQMGFVERYQYWYRRKRLDDAASRPL
jgi:N-acetylglutamate synthase